MHYYQQKEIKKTASLQKVQEMVKRTPSTSAEKSAKFSAEVGHFLTRSLKTRRMAGSNTDLTAVVKSASGT